MVSDSVRSAIQALCAVLGALWILMTLVVLVTSITGHYYLYTANPGGLILPHLSLLGKVYLGSSLAMPFVAFGAIVTA